MNINRSSGHPIGSRQRKVYIDKFSNSCSHFRFLVAMSDPGGVIYKQRITAVAKRKEELLCVATVGEVYISSCHGPSQPSPTTSSREGNLRWAWKVFRRARPLIMQRC